MAHAPVHQPANDSPSTVYDLLYRLMKGTPTWARIVTALVLAVGIGLALGGKVLSGLGKSKDVPPPAAVSATVQGAPIQIQIHNGPYAQPDGSRQIDHPGNANSAPQNLDATHHVDEEEHHYRFHAEHPEDNPELVIIAKLDDQNDVGYKFFSKTDKCVWVLRYEHGVPISQYIKDPAYQDGTSHGLHDAQYRSPGDRKRGPSGLGLFDALVPTAEAAEIEFPAEHGAAKLERVQAGCMNPHGGPFSWWWATPTDQCWSPMYRQWRDGCTHYQMFNRCANAWDGRIFWVTCNPNHSW